MTTNGHDGTNGSGIKQRLTKLRKRERKRESVRQPGELRGAKLGERRRFGIPNKRTVVKKLLVEVMKDKEAQEVVANVVKNSARPRDGVKDSLTILRDFMGVYHGMAALTQPTEANTQRGTANEERFHFLAGRAVRIAEALAPYEHPTFKAIAVVPPPAAPKQIEGEVLDLSDPKQAARAYAEAINGEIVDDEAA